MRVILIGLLMLFSWHNFAQDYQKQRNEIFISNVLSNGLISGVASTFNKKPTEKLWLVFAKNFGKGCLGGMIKYTAKYQTHYLHQPVMVFFAPINRAFFFLGHSIAMNASMNERMLEHYYCHFYGVNFDYKTSAAKGKRLSARLSLGSTVSLIYFLARGDKMDIYKTIEFGQFYLDLSKGVNYKGNPLGGQALYNAISIGKYNGQSYQSVIPHEVVHTYQIYDYFGLTSIYKKKFDRQLSKIKIYNTVARFVDLDYEPLIYSSFYLLQPKPRYFANYFEYEAEHFERRGYVER